MHLKCKNKANKEIDKQPKFGNHLYFYDEGKLVMRIIPEGMTPEETIAEYKRNRCKDIN